MKLSEAKVKGYQLRDIDETCEFYTKEVTIISKQSEDDSFGTVTS